MGMYKLNKNQYVCQKEPAKAFLLYRKDRLWRSLELKNARTEAGTTTRRFLD